MRKLLSLIGACVLILALSSCLKPRPGNSGHAPGHDPKGPGNSENAPGHNKTTKPGNKDKKTPPGKNK